MSWERREDMLCGCSGWEVLMTAAFIFSGLCQSFPLNKIYYLMESPKHLTEEKCCYYLLKDPSTNLNGLTWEVRSFINMPDQPNTKLVQPMA